ncbi:MAG: chemotaxis protein CheW [bacterium]|nr:chemotaxis protein CheW [bacterium]
MNPEDRRGEDEVLLERRARQLAAVPEKQIDRRVAATVAVVAVGKERFGIPVDGLRGILKAPPIAHLPGMPEWLPGIVQVRGELISALDLGRWFQVAGPAEPAFLAVVEGSRGALGLLVESVEGFREVEEEEIAQKLTAAPRAAGRPIRATTRDLVTLLDVERLLESPQIVMGREPSGDGDARES